MAPNVSDATNLAVRLLADAQQAVQDGSFLGRLTYLPFQPNPATGPYPDGLAYVTSDGRDAILLRIAKGPGGEFIPGGLEPAKITGIDILDFSLYTGTNLQGTSLSDPIFFGDLPGFENISLTLSDDVLSNLANASTLSDLGNLLTNYLNSLGGLPTPPPLRPQLSLDEFQALVASQAPVPYDEFGRARGTDGPDLITSINNGGREIGTGGLGPDAWYLKEFDIVTNKKGQARISTKKNVGFTANDYNSAEGDRIFLNLDEIKRLMPNFTEVKLVTVFSEKQRLRAGKRGFNLIYNTLDGGLTLDTNGKKAGFGRGGIIAKFGIFQGLRPALSEDDLVVVDPGSLVAPPLPPV